MSAGFDLDAYLDRIGYAGPRTPTLDVLAALQFHHALAIPFENLNPLLRLPVRLDVASLQAKLVHARRGGYCYEHNLLLSAALAAIGFRVTWLAARVLWNAPETAPTPRSHMLLRIDLDGAPGIVDAGFGGMTLTGPLRLVPDVEQATPHEPFRLVLRDGYYHQQAKIGGEWKTTYRFDLQEQLLADYEVSSFYLCHFPGSHFLTSLIAARAERDGRHVLRNAELAVHHLTGRTDRRLITSAGELRDTLETTFGIQLPESDELPQALERIVRTQVVA